MRRSVLILVIAAVALAGAGPMQKPKAKQRPKAEPKQQEKPKADPLPPLNEKVVSFARSKVGKPVGDGVCITLAMEALQSAGAKKIPLSDPKGDYVWGTPVPDLKDALPGDILQFRDAVFKGKRYITPNRYVTWHHIYPHHTAIVARVEDGGNLITVYHQNVTFHGDDESLKDKVQEGELRMDSLQEGGWVKAYRPVPPPKLEGEDEGPEK